MPFNPGDPVRAKSFPDAVGAIHSIVTTHDGKPAYRVQWLDEREASHWPWVPEELVPA